MRWLTIVQTPDGPQVYVAQLRCHHGAVGLAMVGLGLLEHWAGLVLWGSLVVLSDAKDFPFAPTRLQPAHN